MTRCSNCASEIEDGAAACSWCGQPMSATTSASQLPTGLASPSVAAKAQRRPVSSVVGRLASSDAIPASGLLLQLLPMVEGFHVHTRISRMRTLLGDGGEQAPFLSDTRPDTNASPTIVRRCAIKSRLL